MYLYIDPGTGSLLISTLIGLGLTFLYTVRGFIYRLPYLYSGKKDKLITDFSGKLVFFSEGQRYWRVFQPVIEELIQSGEKVVYLSAEQDDSGLSAGYTGVESYYVGSIRQALFVLNNLKAKMCILTTPQLDVIALKRSKGVRHYCHVIHSPTDIHAYKRYAFDYFDSVLCSSTHQINNLRYLEGLRHTKRKELFETGCTYYDVAGIPQTEEGDFVLLAPTWGDRTFFKYCGSEILELLLKAGHKVIFRPHPQSWISDKGLLEPLLARYNGNPNLIIDKESDGTPSFLKSKVLICDVTSGMLFDMAFIYRKPVIGLTFDWPNGGYEASDLPEETSAVKLLEEIGVKLNVKDVSSISEQVKAATELRITDEIIDRHIFNFREAGKVAARQISTIYKEL